MKPWDRTLPCLAFGPIGEVSKPSPADAGEWDLGLDAGIPLADIQRDAGVQDRSSSLGVELSRTSSPQLGCWLDQLEQRHQSLLTFHSAAKDPRGNERVTHVDEVGAANDVSLEWVINIQYRQVARVHRRPREWHGLSPTDSAEPIGGSGRDDRDAPGC
jgi:hypothetical protein